jgi:PKD repeat protein
MDDPINGQIWGANPCWLTLIFEDNSSVRLKHTFNVRHNDTWIWTIDDFTPYLAKAPITYEIMAPYTITYENTGTGVAGHVWVNDTIPAGTTFESSTPAYTPVSGDTYTWYFTDVAPGTYQITIIVSKLITKPQDSKIIYFRNDVTLDYTDVNGGQPYTTQSAYAVTNVTIPIMTITKQVDPDNGVFGDYLTVTLTIQSNLANGTVIDYLPVELNYSGNLFDDDSDGFIDEEAADGIDNDGDGLIDEDIGNFLFDGAPIKGGLSYIGNNLSYSPVPDGIHTIKFDILIIEKTEIKHSTTNLVRIIHNNQVLAKDTADITLLLYNFAPISFISSPAYNSNLYEDVAIKFNSDGSLDDKGIVAYLWDFGDGNTNTDANPTHTYPDPGEYIVTLTITDSDSNMTTTSMKLTILKSVPMAHIVKPTQLTFSMGEDIYFEGEAIYNGDYSKLYYTWDLGDNSNAYSRAVMHNYLSADKYLVTLTVTDFDGDSSSTTITIVITKVMTSPADENDDNDKDNNNNKDGSKDGTGSDNGGDDPAGEPADEPDDDQDDDPDDNGNSDKPDKPQTKWEKPGVQLPITDSPSHGPAQKNEAKSPWYGVGRIVGNSFVAEN